MYCVTCHNDLALCRCDDIEERLAALRKNSHIEMKWCEKCDKHVDRCTCKVN